MDFAEWLEGELEKRNWRPSELAKAAGLYQSTLWKVLNRERAAGADVCTSLARALRLPPEIVFRQAGLLPPLPEEPDAQQVTKCLDYYKRLPSRVREEVLEYITFKYERENA